MVVIKLELISVNIGKPKHHTFQGQEVHTGIFKQPTDEPVFLTKLGPEGDGQADLVHHGGVDKAVNVYCYERYPFWERELSTTLPLSAFGENLTLQGGVEEDICIGDVYQIGEAIVQVSQPRIPCFKINVRFGRPDVLPKVQQTGYTGFYLRVLQEGHIAKTSAITLLEQQPKKLSVAALNHLFHHDRDNIGAMREALEVTELAEVWKNIFTKLLNDSQK